MTEMDRTPQERVAELDYLMRHGLEEDNRWLLRVAKAAVAWREGGDKSYEQAQALIAAVDDAEQP